MHEITKRLRQARESVTTVGKFRFTIRRPTVIEAARITGSGAEIYEWVRQFVVGWARADGTPVQGVDLGGDTSDTVPFEAELWSEWLADNPFCWEPLYQAILDVFTKYSATLEDSTKN